MNAAGNAVSASFIYADATTDMEFGTTTSHDAIAGSFATSAETVVCFEGAGCILLDLR